jgi:hypothetical protein
MLNRMKLRSPADNGKVAGPLCCDSATIAAVFWSESMSDAGQPDSREVLAADALSRGRFSDQAVKKRPIFVPYLQHQLEKPSSEAVQGAFGVARRCGLDMVIGADGGRLLFVLA